jgi:tetratricopeptide (TPR) repeat protein
MKGSKPIRYRRPALLALGAVLALTMSAYAAPPGYPANVYAADPREMAMVPRYCIYTQSFREKVPGGNNPAEIERWSSLMGHDAFHAMHHYCGGLMETNRAQFLSRTPQERRFYLEHSIVEFDYVIQRVPQDFKLLPEILTKKGEILIRLGRAQLGIVEFQRAIDLRPDYWPPYVQLSDFYKGTGDFQKAREYLEKALSYSPDAKSLKMRLMELDAVNAKRKTAPQSIEQPTKPRPAIPGRPAQETQPAEARPAEPPASALQ